MEQKMAQYATFESMLLAGAYTAQRNVLEAAQRGIFSAAEATRWNFTTQQMERIPYSDACRNWNAYLGDLKPEEVGRLQPLAHPLERVTGSKRALPP